MGSDNFWENLKSIIAEATEIRNHASHYGQSLLKEEILKLRKKAISIIQTTKNLP